MGGSAVLAEVPGSGRLAPRMVDELVNGESAGDAVDAVERLQQECGVCVDLLCHLCCGVVVPAARRGHGTCRQSSLSQASRRSRLKTMRRPHRLCGSSPRLTCCRT